jgi:hypothetical protein
VDFDLGLGVGCSGEDLRFLGGNGCIALDQPGHHSTERLDPRFQLALARKRLLQLVRRQEATSIHDWLSYERGILHYLALIRDLAQETLHAPLLKSIDPREHDGHPSVGMFESLSLLDAELLGDPKTDGLPIRTSKRHSGNYP